MTGTRLTLTRKQILAFRRRAGASGRATSARTSLRSGGRRGRDCRTACPVPRLLSIHARVEGERTRRRCRYPSLLQLWGPRFSAYVVAARDLAVFTLGRLPEGGAQREGARGEGLAVLASRRSWAAGG